MKMTKPTEVDSADTMRLNGILDDVEKVAPDVEALDFQPGIKRAIKDAERLKSVWQILLHMKKDTAFLIETLEGAVNKAGPIGFDEFCELIDETLAKIPGRRSGIPASALSGRVCDGRGKGLELDDVLEVFLP